MLPGGQLRSRRAPELTAVGRTPLLPLADAAIGREEHSVLALSTPVPLQPPWSHRGRVTSPRSCSGHSAQAPACPW